MAKSRSNRAPSSQSISDDVEARLTEVYEGAESWAEEKLEVTRERIRGEPIKSVLIAAAVGALIARLFR